jgi:hypothetical protein
MEDLMSKKSTINPSDLVGSLNPATEIVQPADQVNDLTVA